MKQYEKGGPPVKKKDLPATQQHQQELKDLKQQLSAQAQHIKDLDKEVRQLKNDLRMAISAFNTIRNGKT